MRIGIFTECYHPTLNGVVVSIDAFREVLEARGHKYFIFAPKTKGYQDEKGSGVYRHLSFRWPGQKNYPLAWPFFSQKEIEQIDDLKLDLIHPQHLFTMGKFGLKVGQLLNIPVIHTYHTLIAEYTHYVPLFSNLAKDMIVGMSRKYCNKCDQIVTPSPSMKKVLISYGVRTPIESIPTGVDLDDFKNPYHKEVLKEKWHIPENQKILLYVSRIAREKNLDFLFESIKRLARRRNDFHLLMVGGGPELAYYQSKIVEWGLESVITFTGMQPKEITNRFFGAADIFVFPSVTETQGIVITEAQAAGIPVVAINKMGPSDLIKDGVDGFLTSLKNEEFSAKIEKLLEDRDLRKRMGERGKKNAEKYSKLNSALKMEDLYEHTINCHYPQPQTF